MRNQRRVLHRIGLLFPVAVVALSACTSGADVASGGTSTTGDPEASVVRSTGATESVPIGAGTPSTDQQPEPDAVGSKTEQATGPAASAGNINQTVAPQSPRTLPAVALDQTATFDNDVTLKIDGTESVDVKAMVPGEISGPAVVLDISMTNGTSSPIGLDSVAVTATTANKEPVSELSTDPAAPFKGVLEPGETSSGKYVLLIPKDQRDNVQVTVQYSASVGVVTLTGDF